MTEIERLKELLTTGDWLEMTFEGEVNGFVFVEENSLGSGRWREHWEVITRGPSGAHYRWEYETGLTEECDGTSPSDYGLDIEIVVPFKEMVEVTRWVKL